MPPSLLFSHLVLLMPSSGARLQLAAIEASREWERSGDPCDPIVLLQRCGEDDAAAELWDLKTQQSPRTTTTMPTPYQLVCRIRQLRGANDAASALARLTRVLMGPTNT